MKYIATTCVISQTHRPRPLPNVIEFLLVNDVSYTPDTLIDLERGIYEISRHDPGKAAELREWLDEQVCRYLLLVGRERAVAKVVAALKSCRSLHNLWNAANPSARPRSGINISVAAASIVWERPLATTSPAAFIAINEWFELPGIYDCSKMTWLPGQMEKPVRSRKARLAQTDAPTASLDG